MKNKIVTISREFGSGGRTVGKLVAQKLGIPCYDQELIEKLAEESGFTHEYVQEHSEYTPHSSWLSNVFSGRTINGVSNQDYLWIIQRKIILDIAAKGPCVIVGRCADYILRDTEDLLTVFIHASMQSRAERIVKVYGETENSPEKRLKDKDKRRTAYYEFYTDMQWGKVQNYHVALDSGVIGIEKCADIIVDLYKQLPQEQQPSADDKPTTSKK